MRSQRPQQKNRDVMGRLNCRQAPAAVLLLLSVALLQQSAKRAHIYAWPTLLCLGL